MSDSATILVIHSDEDTRSTLCRMLAGTFDVQSAGSSDAAFAVMESEWVQVVLCEQGFGDGSQLCNITERWPDVISILLASDVGVDESDCESVFQVITQPWQDSAVRRAVQTAVDVFRLRRQNELMSLERRVAGERHEPVSGVEEEDSIVRALDSPMNEICDRIRQVAPFDIPVLISGESGTGKELAARALHNHSLRWQQPFVVENCGALPDDLLESELFGYRKGAFTGAVEDRIGLFERANGGTVFLDEIGEISPAFQVKLLRVLQEQEIRPLGASETRKIDVRVVAATNRDIEAEVAEGRFREDLYYRLSAVTVQIPALRERPGDIAPLANALLGTAVDGLGKPCRGLNAGALASMQAYHWPGNVRELQNEIQRMLVESRDDVLGAELLSPRVLRAAPPGSDIAELNANALTGTLKARIQSIEIQILRESLIRHRWNKSRAAKELGLSRVGLRSKLERYGLEPAEVPATG